MSGAAGNAKADTHQGHAARVTSDPDFTSAPEFVRQILDADWVLVFESSGSDAGQPVGTTAPPPSAKDVELAQEAARSTLSSLNGTHPGRAVAPTVQTVSSGRELYDQKPSRYIVGGVMPPINERGAALIFIASVRGSADSLRLAPGRLAAALDALRSRELHTAHEHADSRAAYAATVLDVLAALGTCDRLRSYTTGLCDRLATVFRCTRVSVGLARGRCVVMIGTSHVDKFVRRQQAVQAIELAMEEAFDQDTDVASPSIPPLSDPPIDRCLRDLTPPHGGRAGGSAACIMLRSAQGSRDREWWFRRAGTESGRALLPRGVLCLERSDDVPFAPAELEMLGVIGQLITPRLLELDRYDRWFGARVLSRGLDVCAGLLGPRHTVAKLVAALVTVFLLVAIFGQGTYRVAAPFRVEATALRAVSAPFEGFLIEYWVRAGDSVVAGETRMARLDDAELRYELAGAEAELSTHRKNAAVARTAGRTADELIAGAEADRAQARIDLLQHRIERALMRAPASGLVLTGDLEKLRGAPVQLGQVLFEVAPIESLRARVFVPEEQVGDVRIGKRGWMACASLPSIRVPFTVVRIEPAAVLHESANSFVVEATLDSVPTWLRPGMEGTARIEIEDRAWVSIWTRRVNSWVRMKLWW